MSSVRSFRDLRVYQELKRLHLEVSAESLEFPRFERFELYELGSQVRRSSNASPAILAEGYGSRHTNIYMEAINRSMGEAQETQHHLDVACEKGYISRDCFANQDGRYSACIKMLERLHQSLSEWRGSKRTSYEVHEGPASYGAPPEEWERVVAITEQVMANFDSLLGEPGADWLFFSARNP